MNKKYLNNSMLEQTFKDEFTKFWSILNAEKKEVLLELSSDLKN